MACRHGPCGAWCRGVCVDFRRCGRIDAPLRRHADGDSRDAVRLRRAGVAGVGRELGGEAAVSLREAHPARLDAVRHRRSAWNQPHGVVRVLRLLARRLRERRDDRRHRPADDLRPRRVAHAPRRAVADRGRAVRVCRCASRDRRRQLRWNRSFGLWHRRLVRAWRGDDVGSLHCRRTRPGAAARLHSVYGLDHAVRRRRLPAVPAVRRPRLARDAACVGADGLPERGADHRGVLCVERRPEVHTDGDDGDDGVFHAGCRPCDRLLAFRRDRHRDAASWHACHLRGGIGGVRM